LTGAERKIGGKKAAFSGLMPPEKTPILSRFSRRRGLSFV
jgi:hypothetical protein